MKKEKVIGKQLSAQPKNAGSWNFVFLAGALLPVLFLFQLIHTYSLNIPYNDDWDAILGFMNTWKHSDAKLALLFSQHNEHRILASKIVYTSLYAVFNRVSILTIIYIANMQLLVIAGVLSYFIRRVLNVPSYWGLLVFILFLCVFDASSYDNSGFAMAGLQNYGVIMLFMVSLFFYSIKSRIALFMAVLFQLLCAFSSGNGIMAGLALLFYNFFSKDKLRLLTCVIAFAVFTALYFVSYHAVENDNGFKAASVNMFVSYFLKLSGAHFNFDNGIVVGICLYAVFFAAVFYQCKRMEWGRILPFIALFLFATMSMAAIAMFRSGQAHIFDSVSISSRYLIYPQLLSIVVLVIVVYRVEKVAYAGVVIGFCCLLFIKSYKDNYDYGAAAFEARYNRLSANKFVYPDKAHAQNVATVSCENGIYCIDEYRP